MNDDTEDKVKWLIALAVMAITAALLYVVMRRMADWVPSRDL